MGIQFDAVSSTGHWGAGDEISVTHTSTGDNLMAVVVVGGYRGGTSAFTFTGVTYDGAAMTFQGGDGRIVDGTNYLRIEVWTKAVSALESKIVKATSSTFPQYSMFLSVATYTGVHSVAQAMAAGAATGTTASVTFTGTLPNSYLVGGTQMLGNAGYGGTVAATVYKWSKLTGDFFTLALGGHKVMTSGASGVFGFEYVTGNDWGCVAVELVEVLAPIDLQTGVMGARGPALNYPVYNDLDAGVLAAAGAPLEVFTPSLPTPIIMSAAADSETRIKLEWIPDAWWADTENTCVGAWQAAGADSYAASLLDLSGNGNDLTAVGSPGWDTVDGWGILDATNYLKTGILTTGICSMIIKFSGGVDYGQVMGVSVYGDYKAFRPFGGGGGAVFLYDIYTSSGYGAGAVTMAFAGNRAFKNGVYQVSMGGTISTPLESYIGCTNFGPNPSDAFSGYVLAAAMYSDQISDADVGVLHNRMSLL